MLAPSEIRGLEEFSETGMVIEIETQVKPGRHLDLARDIRRRIKDAFDREGIEIPYLRQVQLQGSERRDSV